MPLLMAEIGKKMQIIRVIGHDAVRKHLERLGFVAGSEVEVVSELGGNLIVSVKDSRIALDKALASKIIV